MGSIGPMELLVVLVIALLVFGPKKLPEIGRGVGSAIREFKRHSRDLVSFLEEEPEPRRVYPESTPSLSPAQTYPVNASSSENAGGSNTQENGAGDPEEPVPAEPEETNEVPAPAQPPSAPPSNTHPTT